MINHSPQPVRIVAIHHPTERHCVEALELHLSPEIQSQVLQFWHQGSLRPGDNALEVTGRAVRSAHILLFFVSPEFNKRYHDQIEPLISLDVGNLRRVVPVYARPCNWDTMPFSHLRCLPRDGNPLVLDGHSPEGRMHHVASELRELAAELRRSAQEDTAPTNLSPHVTNTLVTLIRDIVELEGREAAPSEPTADDDPMPILMLDSFDAFAKLAPGETVILGEGVTLHRPSAQPTANDSPREAPSSAIDGTDADSFSMPPTKDVPPEESFALVDDAGMFEDANSPEAIFKRQIARIQRALGRPVDTTDDDALLNTLIAAADWIEFGFANQERILNATCARITTTVRHALEIVTPTPRSTFRESR